MCTLLFGIVLCADERAAEECACRGEHLSETSANIAFDCVQHVPDVPQQFRLFLTFRESSACALSRMRGPAPKTRTGPPGPASSAAGGCGRRRGRPGARGRPSAAAASWALPPPPGTRPPPPAAHAQHAMVRLLALQVGPCHDSGGLHLKGISTSLPQYPDKKVCLKSLPCCPLIHAQC